MSNDVYDQQLDLYVEVIRRLRAAKAAADAASAYETKDQIDVVLKFAETVLQKYEAAHNNV